MGKKQTSGFSLDENRLFASNTMSVYSFGYCFQQGSNDIFLNSQMVCVLVDEREHILVEVEQSLLYEKGL